jgi:hypothetical protein
MHTRKIRKYKTKKSKGGMFRRIFNRQAPPSQLAQQDGHLAEIRTQPRYTQRRTAIESLIEAPLSQLAQQDAHLAEIRTQQRYTQRRAAVESLIESTSGNREFMRLCLKYIMVPNLDSVVSTTWLNNDKCNIFLIGEIHKQHTQCVSIFDMFNKLVEDITPNNSKIDLMIELSQSDLNLLIKYKFNTEYKYNSKYSQLDNVRLKFWKCILNRGIVPGCPLRVHWSDATQIDHHVPTKNIYPWLIELAKTPLNNDDWTNNLEITKYFKEETDIPKLLTENTKVMKEIRDATVTNEKFNEQFATDKFADEYTLLRKQFSITNWKLLVGFMLRAVMDFYVVARIIRLDMKNVIFYGGNKHASRIMRILSALDFKTIKVVKGACVKKEPLKVTAKI